MNDNDTIELLALKAELDGMMAENERRFRRDEMPAYDDDAFSALAERIRALKTPEPEPVPAETLAVIEILRKWLEKHGYAELKRNEALWLERFASVLVQRFIR